MPVAKFWCNVRTLVDFTPPILVLLVVTTSLFAAAVVLLRWVLRYRQNRQLRRTDEAARQQVSAFRSPTRLRKWTERGVVVNGILLLLCVLWGFIEPDSVTVTNHTLASPKLRTKAAIRIVQLSDVHSERNPQLESRVVTEVNRIKPDVIVFTGDALNEASGLPHFRTMMTQLAQIAPTYSVRGNWETWWFPDLDLYGKTGVVSLDGRARLLQIRGQEIWLVGIGVDREQEFNRAIAKVPRGSYTILLHHFPALAPRAASSDIDLMLAGDTHGGQARLPFLGEVVRITRHGYWQSRGMHRLKNMWLYVNRGIGNEGGVPRFRFDCRPEIAVIELTGPR